MKTKIIVSTIVVAIGGLAVLAVHVTAPKNDGMPPPPDPLAMRAFLQRQEARGGSRLATFDTCVLVYKPDGTIETGRKLRTCLGLTDSDICASPPPKRMGIETPPTCELYRRQPKP